MLCRLISLVWYSPRGGRRIITDRSRKLGPVSAVGQAGQTWARRQQVNIDRAGAFSRDRCSKCDRHSN
jgi:hypothetical protein